MVAVAALAVLGLIAMWPRGEAPDLGDLPPRTFVNGSITGVEDGTCSAVEVSRDACVLYTADLSSGPDEGATIEFQVLATDVEVPELHEGDKVVLLDFDNSPDPQFRYQFYEYQRSTPLLWLLIAFAVAVIAFGLRS